MQIAESSHGIMTQFWIIEADTVQELETEIYQEIESGGVIEGCAFLSPGQKYYQPIIRQVSDNFVLPWDGKSVVTIREEWDFYPMAGEEAPEIRRRLE